MTAFKRLFLAYVMLAMLFGAICSQVVAPTDDGSGDDGSGNGGSSEDSSNTDANTNTAATFPMGRQIFSQAYVGAPFPTSSLTRVPFINGRL